MFRIEYMNIRHPGKNLGYIIRDNSVCLDVDGELCEVLVPYTKPIEIVVHNIKPFVVAVSGASGGAYIQRYSSEKDNCTVHTHGKYLHSGYIEGNCVLLSQKSDLVLQVNIIGPKNSVYSSAVALIAEIPIDKMIPIRRKGKLYECITTDSDKYRVTFTETADNLDTEPLV